MKKNLIYGLLFTALIACNKKNDNPAPVVLEVKTVNNIAADPTVNSGTGQPQAATGKYTLYSLKDNAVVANTDSTTTKWDIGFRGTTVIINGGSTRSGQGGAYIHTGLFEELTEIPGTQEFSTDESASQLAIPTGSGNGWYNYNPQQNWISPIAGKVLVIRTGDGKFAKLEILNYYKDSPTTPSASAVARHYSFRYTYQPSGTKKF